jgi:multiple sugar transport system permease protein
MWIQTPLWSKMSVICHGLDHGSMMLIFLAVPQATPRELLGGGSRSADDLEDYFLLTPYVFYNLIIGLIAALQIFEPVYVLYRDNQPLAPSAYSMVYYLYQATFRFNEIGYGSAISWLILIIIAVASFIQFRTQNRWVEYEVR